MRHTTGRIDPKTGKPEVIRTRGSSAKIGGRTYHAVLRGVEKPRPRKPGRLTD